MTHGLGAGAIKFGALQSVENKVIGDIIIKMDIDVSGDDSEASVINFEVQKDGGVDEVIKSQTISSTQTRYYKKWRPKEAGKYKLKVQGFKDG
tara:strand:- start:100 stop:378 length:279 start_codon:yes stop_codon:yes gene_type:complete